MKIKRFKDFKNINENLDSNDYNNVIRQAISILDEDGEDCAKHAIALLEPVRLSMTQELRNKLDSFISQDITIGEMLEELEIQNFRTREVR